MIGDRYARITNIRDMFQFRFNGSNCNNKGRPKVVFIVVNNEKETGDKK